MQLDYKKEKVGKEIESQVYESADFIKTIKKSHSAVVIEMKNVLKRI